MGLSTSFADMPDRIVAVLTDRDVGVPHPRDHDPEGCAACWVLDAALELDALRQAA